MIRHFYSFIVETESLYVELSALEISDGEKKHLLDLADSMIHHAIVDSVLSRLSSQDKKTFLKHLNSKNSEKTWKFLNSKIKDAGEKIRAAADGVKKELHEDLKDLKKRD